MLKNPEGLTYDFSRLLLSHGLHGNRFQSTKINWLISLVSDQRDWEVLTRAVQAGLSISKVKQRSEVVSRLMKICMENNMECEYLKKYSTHGTRSTLNRGSKTTKSSVTVKELLSYSGEEPEFKKIRRTFLNNLQDRVMNEGLECIQEEVPLLDLEALCCRAKIDETMKETLKAILKFSMKKFYSYYGSTRVPKKELLDYIEAHSTSLFSLLLILDNPWYFYGHFYRLKNRERFVQMLLHIHKQQDVIPLDIKASYFQKMCMNNWLFEQEEVSPFAIQWVKQHVSGRVHLHHFSEKQIEPLFSLLNAGIKVILFYGGLELIPKVLLRNNTDVESLRTYFKTYMDCAEPIHCAVNVSDSVRETVFQLYQEGIIVLTGKVSVHGWVRLLLERPEIESYVQLLIQRHYESKVDWIGWTLEEIECAIGLVSSTINRLSLCSSGIEVLPNSVRRFQHLNELILYNNDLQTLPTWLSELEQLNTISITNNSMDVLPEVLSSLPSLETIYSDFVSKTELSVE